MNAVADRREQFDRGEERRGEATTTFNLADCGRPKRMRDVARRKQEYKGWMSNGGRKEGIGRQEKERRGEQRRGGKRRPLKHGGGGGGGKHAKAGTDGRRQHPSLHCPLGEQTDRSERGPRPEPPAHARARPRSQSVNRLSPSRSFLLAEATEGGG